MKNTANRKMLIAMPWLIVALLCSLIIAASIGTAKIAPLDIVKMISNKLSLVHFTVTWKANEEVIIFQVRLLRVVAGALIGGALATAGVLFQGLLRNPMADPYIIGTSAGAAFGATVAMLFPLSLTFAGFGLVPIAAFLGALGAVLLVYNLARIGGKTPIVSMLLAGFAVSAMLSATMALLLALSGKLNVKLSSVFAFLMGGISVRGWEQIAIISIMIIAGIIMARLFAFKLNAFLLGEEGAAYVGVNVERDKMLILITGSLLTAAAVSIGGLIGFVGLVIPHAVRMAIGPNHKFLIPVSAFIGGIFLVLADLLARTVVSPAEIPVGVITALIGAPVFLYLLRRSRREYAF